MIIFYQILYPSLWSFYPFSLADTSVFFFLTGFKHSFSKSVPLNQRVSFLPNDCHHFTGIQLLRGPHYGEAVVLLFSTHLLPERVQSVPKSFTFPKPAYRWWANLVPEKSLFSICVGQSGQMHAESMFSLHEALPAFAQVITEWTKEISGEAIYRAS